MCRSDLSIARFRLGCIAPDTFTHGEHLRMAFVMLHRYEFLEAALYYSRALRRMCARAGHPEKFNQTLTIAFLSLIAERIAADPCAEFEAFVAGNPDLMNAGMLARHYSAQRLSGAIARRTFLLPDLC